VFPEDAWEGRQNRKGSRARASFIKGARNAGWSEDEEESREHETDRVGQAGDRQAGRQLAVKSPKGRPRLTPVWRAVIETGFIIFLFYSNLLMGEFTRSHAHGKSLAVAVEDVFTVANFSIAVISALIGYLIVEYLRKRL
jgi:hypothetical protein